MYNIIRQFLQRYWSFVTPLTNKSKGTYAINDGGSQHKHFWREAIIILGTN